MDASQSGDQVPKSNTDDVEFIVDAFESTRPMESKQRGKDTKSSLSGEIRPTIYGEKTTFGSVPWWNEKDWWKISSNGEGNDVRAHLGGNGRVAVAAVSLRGNRHRLQGCANQDYFAMTTTTLDDGRSFVIAVVCDGMGSAKHSGFGARMFAYHTLVAIKTTIEAFPSTYAAELIKDQAGTLRYISNRVIDYRQDDFEAPELPFGETKIEDLQCTMTFVVVPSQPKDSESGVHEVLTGMIGDSPVFILRDGDWHSIDEIQKTEAVWNSATSGALGADSLGFAQLEIRPSDAILMATDGVGNYVHFQGKTTSVGQDLARRWARPPGLHEFIRDNAFELQGADDDRTSIMIWFNRD